MAVTRPLRNLLRLLLVLLAIRDGVFVYGQLGDAVPDLQATDAELVDLAKKLREADSGKARYCQVQLDLQAHTNGEDAAQRPLFKKVDPSLLQNPTIQKLIALFDNYNKETGVEEAVTPDKQTRLTEFVDAIFASKPFSIFVDFLKSKGHPMGNDPKLLRQWFDQLWFGAYSRAKGKKDTSGFEHVIIGESKNGEVSGLHNWVRVYRLEQTPAENFNYKGFIVKRYNNVASVAFNWGDLIKKSGSFLVGTSPEYDMALFTACFLARRGDTKCNVEIDSCPISVKSYDLKQNGQVYIGTLYPEAGALTPECKQAHRREAKCCPNDKA